MVQTATRARDGGGVLEALTMNAESSEYPLDEFSGPILRFGQHFSWDGA